MRPIFLLLLIFLIINVFIGIGVFMTAKTAQYFHLRCPTWLKIILGATALLPPFGLIYFMNRGGITADILYDTAAIVLGILMLYFFMLIATEIFRLFLPLSLPTFGLIAVTGTILLSTYGIWNSWHPIVKEVNITMTNLPQKIKAVQLSDIHLGHFRAAGYLQKIVDIVNAQKPDVVFITGDLFDGNQRVSMQTIAPLKNIHAPIYAVQGNHDIYAGWTKVDSLLRQTGVHVLENEMTIYKGIQLIGLLNTTADKQSFDIHGFKLAHTIKSILAKLDIDPDRPSILLHHSPIGVKYARQKGIDLFLAGHTHGGQMFPITIINHYFFTYNKGLYHDGATKVYVTQGVGTFGPPMRIGTDSEITVINISPRQN